MSRRRCFLLDTNIWLDVYLGDRKHHGEKSELLSKLINNGAAILYPTNALADVSYIISASLKRELRASGAEPTSQQLNAISEIAWACANNMTEVAAIAPIDSADVWIGMKHRAIHEDLEDDLVIAAGMRAQVDFLVTNDKKFLAKSPLPTLSSPDMLALLKSWES